MFKTKLEGRRGITLIALVITIIVLLILAGVSITMLTGDNGILTQANNAKIEQSHGAVREGIALAYNEWQIELNTASTTKLASTEVIQIQGKEEKAEAPASSFIDFLVSKGYCDSNGIINTEKLTGSKQALGNGTGTEDVYKIEEQDGEYIVNYYDNSQSKREIWSVNSSENSNENTPTSEEFFRFNEETGKITGIVENTTKDPNGIGYYYEGDEKILSKENVVIPEKINGVTVTAIDTSVFADCYNLKSIVIPDTVTEIGWDCFQNCSSLTEIILPSNLERIYCGAFNGCSSLTTIIIPSSVKYLDEGYSGVDAYTFTRCVNLTSIILEKGSTLEVPENKWGATNATVTREK